MLVPIRAEHLKTAYLRGASHMLADARANIVITDTDKTDRLRYIIRQTTGIYTLRQLISGNELKGHGQILVYQLIHPSLNLFLFLT